MTIRHSVLGAFSLLLVSPLAPAQQDRILSELQAVYPHSTPGPVTSTPAGEFLFVAEAGVLAVIDTSLGQTGFEDPTQIKSESISSQGVRAVELLLDPDASLNDEDPAGDEDLLYVAGGRLGLWALEADLRDGYPMPATRIDAGEIAGVSDRSWCNSVEILEIGETRYLVALFAHKGCSRLRLYALDDVRELFDSTITTYAEIGNELTPASNVGVGGNCSFQTPRMGSFGYGMSVDGNKVYVAMGRYGLVRAQFTSTTTVSVTAGPYFGTGSYYNNTYGAGYDNFEFRVENPADETLVIVTRSDPPYFVDVVVQDDGEDHLLWAAVDHLGLVAFDLTGAWSSTMPIVNQEGIWVASDELEDTRIQLVDDPATEVVRTNAHRLAIVEATDGEASGLVLAVGVNSRPLLLSDSIYDEGRTLEHLGIGYQGTGHPSGSTEGTFQMTLEEVTDAEEEAYESSTAIYEYTVLYDLTDLTLQTPNFATKTIQHAKFLRLGGRHLYLPPTPPQDEFLVLGGHFHAKTPTPPAQSFLAVYDWPFQGDPFDQPGAQDLLVRTMPDRPGWHAYDISFSPTTPELVYIGSNDAGCAPAGIMADCGSSFVQFTPTAGVPDKRGTFGILYNPLAIWEATDEIIDEVPQERDFIFGAGRPPATGGGFQKPHWMLVYFDPGVDVCATTPTRPPDRRKTIYVQSPEDAFTHRGRGFYNGASGWKEAYDIHVGEGNELAFVGRSASPAGMWVLNRSELEELCLDSGTVDEFVVPDTNPDVYHRELNTHPEFDNAYFDDTPPQDFLRDNGLNGRVITLYPELMQIPDPENDPRWVLAVPCAAVQLPPDLEVFGTDPVTHEWYPENEYVTNYDHAMVRVFDVHIYEEVTTPNQQLSVYTLLGPRDQSAAVRLRTLTWEGRHFLLVTNFTDSLMVWEITNLLGREDLIVDPDDGDYYDYLLEEWITPKSISDDLPNNAWHLEVANEEWNDGQSTRDEVYVYVAVGRFGIAVLNFQPDASAGQRLVLVEYLRTPNGMGGMKIRDDGGDEQTLLISETHAGLRTYVYPE